MYVFPNASSGVRGHPGLHSKCKASLNNITARPWLKKVKGICYHSKHLDNKDHDTLHFQYILLSIPLFHKNLMIVYTLQKLGKYTIYVIQ